jgi:hypothetical protein
MPVIKAHYFSVTTDGGTARDVATCLEAFCGKGDPSSCTVGMTPYHFAEAEWHTREKAITASVFKIRSEALPSAVSAGAVGHLPIPATTDLGEPMCFAYYPYKNTAIVQYAHNGPRHTLIKEFLSAIGFGGVVYMEPILRPDMLERLERTRFVRSFTFKLRSPQQQTAIANAGAPVSQAISALQELKGNDVGMTVSVGREKRSLLVTAVKKVSRALLRIDETELSALVLDAAENEGQKCEKLDLLNARRIAEIEVRSSHRELDRKDCQRKLITQFESDWPEIVKYSE